MYRTLISLRSIYLGYNSVPNMWMLWSENADKEGGEENWSTRKKEMVDLECGVDLHAQFELNVKNEFKVSHKLNHVAFY